jgi:hypothetical protein
MEKKRSNVASAVAGTLATAAMAVAICGGMGGNAFADMAAQAAGTPAREEAEAQTAAAETPAQAEQSAQAATEPQVQQQATRAEAQTQQQTHEHSWSPVYRTETASTTVVDQEGHVEQVKVGKLEFTCSGCGYTCDTEQQMAKHQKASWAALDAINPRTGNRTAKCQYYTFVEPHYESRWVEPVTHVETSTQQVLDHYECSCGATK